MLRSSVVPLVTWTHPGAANRPTGLPLSELFAEVLRLVWAAPGVSDSRRKSARRSAELARSLPSHPSPAEVAAWVESLRRIFPSEHTIALHLRTVATVYRYGSELSLSTGNPAAIMARIVRRPAGDPRPLADIGSKWPLLLSACRTPREALFLALMRFAGLRKSEALGLWHADVNTFGDPWRLEVVRQRPSANDMQTTRTKTECGQRELPVRPALRELLAPVLAEGEPVIRTGFGGGERAQVPYLCPFRERDLEDLGERCRAACPEDFPRGHKLWHALRDTCAVELLAHGKARSEIASALGHSSEYVTRTHYLGHVGRRVDPATFAGLDPPCGAGPPGPSPAVERREARVAAPAPRRRSRESGPTVRKEGTRCGTPTSTTVHGSAVAAIGGTSTARTGSVSAMTSAAGVRTSTTPAGPVQRSLPRLAAGPVTRRPRRS